MHTSDIKKIVSQEIIRMDVAEPVTSANGKKRAGLSSKAFRGPQRVKYIDIIEDSCHIRRKGNQLNP
jgi:hypothetical protein